MTKVSVIIPVYNYAKYLMDAFQSIIFEMEDMEIIIVNDGSTDNAKEIIEDIFRPFAYPERQMKYIPLEKNMGVSVARNCGLRESGGEYITFLDADDMRVPGSFVLQRRYLDKHSDIDVVYGTALEVRGDVRYHYALSHMRTLRVHPAKVNPQTVMYRRKVFERHGGWYEGLRSGEDKEMSMRLGVHPESPFNLVKAKKLKKPIAFYRKHPNEKHKLRKADPVWKKETKLIQKRRIKQLKREGITRENTLFPI